jgi:hypothetical protein
MGRDAASGRPGFINTRTARLSEGTDDAAEWPGCSERWKWKRPLQPVTTLFPFLFIVWLTAVDCIRSLPLHDRGDGGMTTMGIDDMVRKTGRTFERLTFPVDIYVHGGSCIRAGMFRVFVRLLTFKRAGQSTLFIPGAFQMFYDTKGGGFANLELADAESLLLNTTIFDSI